jgi:hypothetical protein
MKKNIRILIGSVSEYCEWPKSPSPGDILYLDSGDGMAGAYIVKLDPQTKQQSIIVSNLLAPEALAVDQRGQLLVSSSCYVLRINPATGAQVTIANLREYGDIWGMDLAGDGDIFASYIGGKLTGPRNRHIPDFVKARPDLQSG